MQILASCVEKGQVLTDVWCGSGVSVDVKDATGTQGQGMCAGQGKSQLGVSLPGFVTVSVLPRDPVLLFPALGPFPGSLPALALLCQPSSGDGNGNGDARQVHSSMRHTHLLA